MTFLFHIDGHWHRASDVDRWPLTFYGFLVYITRAEHGRTRRENPIPETDWQALISSDSSLFVSEMDH
jgi:hypothetical protein